MLSQEAIAVLYNRLAAVYDIWARLTESKALRRSLELADIEDGQRILEVAVGTGLAFREIVNRNPHGRNVGIDISEGMLEKARQRLRTAGDVSYELSVASTFDIKEADKPFDMIMSSYMFDLLDEDDWSQALKEFYRVLSVRGILLLVNMTIGERPGSGIYQGIFRLSPSLMGGCRGVRLSGAVENAGFTIKVREYVQQSLFPSEVILAIKTD